MLTKLIKYDIKSTYRSFLGIYLAILLGITIIPIIFNTIGNEFIKMITGFVAFGISVAVVVVVITNLFQLFNTNLYSKQGYLTLTLPVTSRDIVISKLIVSTMWILLTSLVAIFSLLLFAVIVEKGSITDILQLSEALKQLDVYHISTLLLFVLAMIFTCIKEMAKLFLSCSIAHLKQFNRFRVPAGILSYFAFSWMETLFVQMGFFTLSFITKGSEFIYQIEEIVDTNNIDAAFGLFNGLIASGILYSIILTTLFSISNIWLLNHKLDLE